MFLDQCMSQFICLFPYQKEYPAGVFYNELETRVRLSKRRKVRSVFGRPQPVRVDTGKVRLMVKHREFNYDESQAQLARLEMLKHESELEEVEEGAVAASGSEKSEGNQEAVGDEEAQDGNSSMNSPASSLAGRFPSAVKYLNSSYYSLLLIFLILHFKLGPQVDVLAVIDLGAMVEQLEAARKKKTRMKILKKQITKAADNNP